MLDKKHRHKELSDCWLFATLELCAPGARNAPKISCSERIVNARISEIWFGIEDKNPTVDHGGIDHMQDHDVIVHQFAPEFHKEIEGVNKEFMKWTSMKNYEVLNGLELKVKFLLKIMLNILNIHREQQVGI